MTTDYTLTTHIGTVTLTRIVPLVPDIVRFALTAKIPEGAHTFSEQVLSLYGELLLTRTKRKKKTALESYLKQYGIELSVSTGIESITFTGSLRASNIARVSDLLIELIRDPLVDEDEFGKKRKLAIEENREEHDNAKRIAHVNFVNMLYAHEPRLTLDTLDEELAHVKKARAEDVRALERSLPASTWYLTLVGTAEAEYALMPLAAYLGTHGRESTRAPITALPLRARAAYTTVPAKTNVEVYLGNVCPITDEDPAFLALDFGIDVLGMIGAFSGRLMSIVRQKEGLTYDIHARTNTHHRGDAFHYVIRTFFMAKDYEKGIASIRRELTRLVTNGITDRELTTFKEIIKNRYVLAHESNETRLHLYHPLTVRGYDEYVLRERHAAIGALTKREVNHALRTHIDPTQLVIGAAGPIDKDGTPIVTGAA